MQHEFMPNPSGYRKIFLPIGAVLVVQIAGLEEYWLFAAILDSCWNVEHCEWTSSNHDSSISQTKAEEKLHDLAQKKKKCCQDLIQNGENGIWGLQSM